MAALLAAESSVFVVGTVEIQTRFYDRFSAVVLLTASVDVLLDRVARRTDNPYGSSPQDQNEIRGYVLTVELLLGAGATHTFAGRAPISELADAIEPLARG